MMKSLNAYLTEKLLVNKNYKGCKTVIDEIVDEIYNNDKLKECIKQSDDSFDSQKELIDILAEASLASFVSRNDVKKHVKKHIDRWWRNKKLFDNADKCTEYLSWGHSATIIDNIIYKLTAKIEDNAGDAIEYNELNFPAVGKFDMMVEAYQSDEYVTFIISYSKSERFILLGMLICKLQK